MIVIPTTRIALKHNTIRNEPSHTGAGRKSTETRTVGSSTTNTISSIMKRKNLKFIILLDFISSSSVTYCRGQIEKFPETQLGVVLFVIVIVISKLFNLLSYK